MKRKLLILLIVTLPFLVYSQAGGVKIDRTTTPKIWSFDGSIVTNDIKVTDTLYEDLRMSGNAFRQGALSKPDFDYDSVAFSFDDNATETLYATAQMAHIYDTGTSVHPHIHWSQSDTGRVYWQLEYRWYSVGDNLYGFTTDTVTVGLILYTLGDGTIHQVSEFSEIIGTGKKVSSMWDVKLSRVGGDVLDTYDQEALFKEFDIHFIVDKIGSANEF